MPKNSRREDNMISKDRQAKVLSRRQVLTTSALLVGGLAVPRSPFVGSAAAAQTTVKFAGWAFEPQVVEANVKRFMEQNPDIRVDYTPLDLQLYNEKMVALFNASSQGDAFYIRDTNLGSWVEAGWVQPIDGMPGVKELNDDMFPFIREAMFYKGKQYGTPYYGDIYVYMYDKKALQQAGISKAPATLDGLKDAALEIKKAGAVQYPILKGFKTNVDGLSEFWSMVFASGGRLFNEALDPVYPNQDKTALGVLEWLVEAMHGWKILDPRGLELDETQARDVYLSGQGIFTSNVGNVIPRANNPQISKRAGDIQMMRFPALQDLGKGPMGWSRLYGISSETKVKDAAWRLIYYLGGKDAKGEYFSAKDWYLKYGIGYPFKSLDQDPDIQAAQKKTGYDLEVLRQQFANSRARENINATWYSEWDRFTQQQIQSALLRQVKPAEALAASAKKAQDLKKSGG
ncbi:MAG: ABC-type sugar transport system, periplasmic component [Rhodospirillales bacterium]|nr:ABC-type sugar transport system, periplasmic component [Rhodospirillales bacterium]